MSTEILEIIHRMLLALLVILLGFLLFWKLWFLRDPKRIIPITGIVSPADGKVNKIIRINKKTAEIEKGKWGKFEAITSDVSAKCKIISIVMSPLDVHIQRAPIRGRIEKIRYYRGRFRNAMRKEIAIDNERNEILIKGKEHNIKVIQIAGALARRISCFVKEGQIVKKGQRIGLINLGSQVSVIIPDNINLIIKEGDRTTAGETIIAQPAK